MVFGLSIVFLSMVFSKQNSANKDKKTLRNFLFVVIFFGVLASFVNAANNRSMWGDEVALALNIVDRSYLELLQPLDYAQVAPIGFLLLTKTFTLIFGNFDWVLRIIPFLSYLLSIPLCFLVSKHLLHSRTIAFLTTAFFSTNTYIIYYSWEAKQYSLDILIALISLYNTLYFQRTKEKSALIIYCIMGVFAVWFSHSAIIILFTVGIYTLYIHFIVKRKRQFISLIPIFFWIFSFFIYYFSFIYNHPSKKIMNAFWQNYFLPYNPFTFDFFFFLYKATGNVLFNFINYHTYFLKEVDNSINLTIGVLILLVSFIGVCSLWKNKKKNVLFFIFFPFLTHLFLSYFKFYPFAKRFFLYSEPFTILLFVCGSITIFNYFQSKIISLAYLVLFLPFFVNSFLLIQTLPHRHGFKDALTYIEKKINEEEDIYLHYWENHMKFYKNFYPKIKQKNIYFFKDIKSLPNKAWLIFNGYDTRVIEELNKNNFQISDIKVFSNHTDIGKSDIILYKIIQQPEL